MAVIKREAYKGQNEIPTHMVEKYTIMYQIY